MNKIRSQKSILLKIILTLIVLGSLSFGGLKYYKNKDFTGARPIRLGFDLQTSADVGDSYNFEYNPEKIKKEDGSQVKTVSFFVDDELNKTCEGFEACDLSLGPFTSEDVGMHTYKVDYVYDDGTTNTDEGEYVVEEEEEDVPVQVPSPAENRASETTPIEEFQREPTSPNQKAPTTTISADKETVGFEENFKITATANAGSKTLRRLEILSNTNTTYKSCTISPCIFSSDVYGAWPNGSTYGFRTRATFTDGTTLESSLITVMISYAITEPTVSLSTNKTSVPFGEDFELTAIAYSGTKTLSELEITDHNSITVYKSCATSPCVFSSDVYGAWPEGGSFAFKARATFTDGTTLISDGLISVINQPALTQISIAFSPEQQSVTASESCTITSTVETDGKTISSHEIYTAGELKMTCDTDTCVYSARASTMLGYTPSRSSADLEYYSKVTFSDGTTKTDEGNTVTVTN